MKRAGLFAAIVLILLLAGAVLDVLTTSELNTQDRLAANRFLTEHSKPTPPRTFTHDGCTLFPDYLLWHDIRTACRTHDIAYWAGGTAAERRAADLEFRADIAHTGLLGPLIAPIAYTGVRLFGDTVLTKALHANWGYGWND